MYRRALLAGLVLLLASFGASSQPLHSSRLTTSTSRFICPELPPDCCRTALSHGCILCTQGGC